MDSIFDETHIATSELLFTVFDVVAVGLFFQPPLLDPLDPAVQVGQQRFIFLRLFQRLDEGLRQGHIAYVINTRDPGANEGDGVKIRLMATEHNVTLFTALDTIKVLLDVLEETTLTISTIDA